MNKKKTLVVMLLALAGANTAWSQAEYNPIPASVQMLNLAPEARGTAMGDAGVATTPDINSQHWNPAKYAFMDSKAGASLSITPWLRKIVSDINLFYAVGYYRINKRSTVSASLRYFDIGDLVFFNEEGLENGNYKPNEFAVDGSYSLLLSENFSGAVSMRYIHSDLGFQQDDDGYSAGNAFAMDLAFFFKKKLSIGANNANLMAGINLSNMGTKITYDDGVTNEYLPANMRLGVGFWYDIDQYNRIGATVDVNKLMVPTPTYRSLSKEDGVDVYSEKMKYYDQSVVGSFFTSFGDAPGGAREELQEIDLCGGIEYVYNNMFAARGGYHYNHENKGNLKYATVGLGLKYQMLEANVSYIFTIGTANSNSALANTIRISLAFDIGKIL